MDDRMTRDTTMRLHLIAAALIAAALPATAQPRNDPWASAVPAEHARDYQVAHDDALRVITLAYYAEQCHAITGAQRATVEAAEYRVFVERWREMIKGGYPGKPRDGKDLGLTAKTNAGDQAISDE